jgi:hypothetical protein
VNPIEGIKALRRPSVLIPSPWLMGGALLVVAWIGWAIYAAADRGTDAGLGVLVAWPTLLLMAAIVTAPLAALAFWIVRSVRGSADAPEAQDDDENEAEDEASPGLLAVRDGPVAGKAKKNGS